MPDHPANFPFADYRRLEASGQQLYGVDTRQSWVRIKVNRGGILARLGHNHIVSTHLIRGVAAVGQGSARADLFIKLTDLLVDLPDLRAQAGDRYNSRPSADDIAATRANMLGEKVLDAARAPFVELHFQLIDDLAVTTLKLRDATARVSIPNLPSMQAAKQPVRGVFHLKLSDFGIAPFTALGGALRVLDGIEIEYRLQLRAATSVGDAFAIE